MNVYICDTVNGLCMSVVQLISVFLLLLSTVHRLELIRVMDRAELWLHRSLQLPGSLDTDAEEERRMRA